MKITNALKAFSLTFALSHAAQASVYNLHFHETDNDGDTASKTESSKTDAAKPAVTPSTSASAPAPTPTAPVTLKVGDERPKFHLNAHLGSVARWKKVTHQFTDSSGNIVTTYQEKIAAPNYGSLGLTAGYFPLSYLGFNANLEFGGFSPHVLASAEMEVIPFKLTLFGFTELLELGIMGGMTHLAEAGKSAGSLYLGGRLGLNFGSRWTFNITARGNSGFLASNFGLGYRF